MPDLRRVNDDVLALFGEKQSGGVEAEVVEDEGAATT
jgi:hypothetical protein